MSDNKIDLAIVVNGQPTVVSANKNAPLRTVIPRALEQTGNAGQPPDNWELRDAAGALSNRPPMAEGTAIFTVAATELKTGVRHRDSDSLFQAVLGTLRNVDDLRHTSRTAAIPKVLVTSLEPR